MGRGNMYGRGYNNQRYNQRANQNVYTKKVSEENTHVETNQVHAESSKSNTNVVPSIKKDLNDKGKGIVDGNTGVAVNSLRGNGQPSNVQNRFAALASDQCSEGNEGLEVYKSRIDEICGKGELVSGSERKNWSNDVKKYYEVKIKESIKGMNEEGMKSTI